MEVLSSLAIPSVILLISLMLLFSKHAYFDEFLEGAKDGLRTGVNLLPTLVALMVAVSMLSASGAVDYVAGLLAPLGEAIGVPMELLPLIITRPVSGSGSTAILADLFDKYGPDSFTGLCASVIMGSSETMIYVIAVYFSSVNVKRTRHALPAAFLTMIFCIFFSCLICRLFFA
ncbi:MAG: spore maturation protein [Clostridiales bacterium]|nr:spore maturation protein [Clostridiales bacterium]